MSTKKRVLLDTSSAILLYKAGLHTLLAHHYQVIMPQSVFSETTQQNRVGSAAYLGLVEQHRIAVEAVRNAAPCADTGLLHLDQGERDCLLLFLSGRGDFIITDDGAAAKYCRKKTIPFVNALLIPRILTFTNDNSGVCLQTAYGKIKREGRYADVIKSYADNTTHDDLRNFFPV